MTDGKRDDAIHEAGHAVIGRVLGMVCGHVTIRADDESSGHAITVDPHETIWSWENAGKFRDVTSVWRGRIMTFQAGALAEIAILGTCAGGDEDDQYQIKLMAEHWNWPEHKIMAMCRQTQRLIHHYRTTIERVATALIDRTRLSSEEADVLVWPKAITMRDFVTFRQLHSRFAIKTTRDNLNCAMRLEVFPRSYLFNRRVMWRARDIQQYVDRQS